MHHCSHRLSVRAHVIDAGAPVRCQASNQLAAVHLCSPTLQKHSWRTALPAIMALWSSETALQAGSPPALGVEGSQLLLRRACCGCRVCCTLPRPKAASARIWSASSAATCS